MDEVNVSAGLNVTGVTTLTNNVELISGELFINDKITHADDTNTTIRFPSADTIQFETGGSNRLQINSSGTATFSGDITANGNIAGDNSTNISGISSVTATTFYGSGANLTGIDATSIKDGGGTVRVQGNTSGIVITGVSTFSLSLIHI